MKSRRSLFYRAFVIAIVALTLVPLIAEGAPPSVDRGRRGGGGGGGGGGETSVGNNLSFPVIWSDGVTKVLRGTYGSPVFDGAYVTDASGVKWYLQQDANNTWQAESAIPTDTFNVDWVNWGDNLEARAWPDRSQVRIETTLIQDLTTPMTGFTMQQTSGSGITEMWGTNTQTYASTQATVYSGAARLTIQKVDATKTLTWDASTGQWTGTGVLGTYFNGAVADAGDGPGYYSAEINVSGKLVYGYNWNMRTPGMSGGPGSYRITFSLDTEFPGLNTYFDANTQIVPSAEEEAVIAAEGGGVAAMDPANNLSYIDVNITSSGSGGGGGGGVESLAAAVAADGDRFTTRFP